MSIQNMLNQFMGATSSSTVSRKSRQSFGGGIGNLANNIPGGLAGGAAAGGIMALLVGNKSARKFAGKAATYGGAALLGGIAFKAFRNWQQSNRDQQASGYSGQSFINEDRFISNEVLSPDFELTLVKAMVAAAKADGHIDSIEQQRIFKAVEGMGLSAEMKGMVFDLLQRPISVVELAQGAQSIEQKSELYLASCMVIDLDQPSERIYLDNLALALNLPIGLTEQINWQAQQALNEEAA